MELPLLFHLDVLNANTSIMIAIMFLSTFSVVMKNAERLFVRYVEPKSLTMRRSKSSSLKFLKSIYLI